MPKCPHCGATNKEGRETCWNCWARISDSARLTGTPAAKVQIWVIPKTKEITPKVIAPPRVPPLPVKGHFNFPTRAKKEEPSNDNITCPHCSATNSATRSLCWSCWQPLDEPVESTSTTAPTSLPVLPILEVTIEQHPIVTEAAKVLPARIILAIPQQAEIEVQPAPQIELAHIFELPIDVSEPIEPEQPIKLQQIFELPVDVPLPIELITESEPEPQEESTNITTLPEEILPYPPPCEMIIPDFTATTLSPPKPIIIEADIPIIVAEENNPTTTLIAVAPSAPEVRISVAKNYSQVSWYGLLSVTITVLTMSAMLCWRLWLQPRTEVVRITRLTQTYLSSLEQGDINTQMKLATAGTKGKRLPAWITLGSSTLLEPKNIQGDEVTYAVKLYLIPAEGRSERIPSLQKALSRQYQVDLVLRQEAGRWLVDQRQLANDVKKCLTEENPGIDFPAW